MTIKPLPPSYLAVWYLTAVGWTPEEIARELHITPKTVWVTQYHLRDGMSARHNVDLSIIGMECGLISVLDQYDLLHSRHPHLRSNPDTSAWENRVWRCTAVGYEDHAAAQHLHVSDGVLRGTLRDIRVKTHIQEELTTRPGVRSAVALSILAREGGVVQHVEQCRAVEAAVPGVVEYAHRLLERYFERTCERANGSKHKNTSGESWNYVQRARNTYTTGSAAAYRSA